MNNKNDDGFRSLVLDGWWYEALSGESDLSWSGSP